MRIAIGSPSAERLAQHGVGESEIAATRFYVFNFQIGAAITLPVPLLGPVVLIKGKRLVRDADGELADGPAIRFPVHELCHARQVLDWGTLRYLARHIWARIKTRSVLAANAPEEVPCYEAQEAAEAFYANPGSG